MLQERAIAAHDFAALGDAILALGCRLETMRLVPFAHKPDGPMPTVIEPCLVYGSSGLLNLARKVGWRPAGWQGSTFAMSALHRALGEIALNHDGKFAPASRIAETATAMDWSRVFIRPDGEDKLFSGQVLTRKAAEDWVALHTAAGFFEPDDPLTLVAPVRNLGREWRCFVVDGEIIEACRYAWNGGLDPRPGAPANVLAFAADVIARFCPAPCFVLDIAERPDNGTTDLRVVEVNSINSAGWYACDIAAIVRALSVYVVADAPES